MAAENVRAFRVLRRLSQDELASMVRAAGVLTFSRQAVSDVERGRRSITVDELAGVANALSLTVADLLSVDHFWAPRP